MRALRDLTHVQVPTAPQRRHSGAHSTLRGQAKQNPQPAEAEPGAPGERITHLKPKRLALRRVARRSGHTANASPPKVTTAATTRISRS